MPGALIRSRGSYSYALPGRSDSRAALAAPVDNSLFFAGEACSADDFSTAEKDSFSIGDRVKSRAMREVSPGKYVAAYTIRKSDQFQNAIAVARLQTAGGDVFTAEANKPVGVTAAGPLDSPKLNTPAAADIVDNQLTLHGTAAPGARVSIKITYSQTLLGLLKTTGTVADLVVDTDQNGRFVTKPIALDTGLGSSNVTYTVTAITLGANNQNSQPTTLTIKR